MQIICKAVKCRIGPMRWQELSSYLKFSSKLMASAVQDKFGHYMYDQISFTVLVMATIVDANIASVSGANSTMTRNIEFIFKPVEPIVDAPLPKWPIFVGAIIGLLILIAIIWALKKVCLLVHVFVVHVMFNLSLFSHLSQCGFFKKASAPTEKSEDDQEEEEEEEIIPNDK